MTAIQVQAQIVLRSATKSVLHEKPQKAFLSAAFALMIDGKEVTQIGRQAEINFDDEPFEAAENILRLEFNVTQ